jgi:hypothetical protein
MPSYGVIAAGSRRRRRRCLTLRRTLSPEFAAAAVAVFIPRGGPTNPMGMAPALLACWDWRCRQFLFSLLPGELRGHCGRQAVSTSATSELLILSSACAHACARGAAVFAGISFYLLSLIPFHLLYGDSFFANVVGGHVELHGGSRQAPGVDVRCG